MNRCDGILGCRNIKRAWDQLGRSFLLLEHNFLGDFYHSNFRPHQSCIFLIIFAPPRTGACAPDAFPIACLAYSDLEFLLGLTWTGTISPDELQTPATMTPKTVGGLTSIATDIANHWLNSRTMRGDSLCRKTILRHLWSIAWRIRSVKSPTMCDAGLLRLTNWGRRIRLHIQSPVLSILVPVWDNIVTLAFEYWLTSA